MLLFSTTFPVCSGKVEESRVEELTNTSGCRSTLPWNSSLDVLTSQLLDFLTLLFVFINIPGLFRDF